MSLCLDSELKVEQLSVFLENRAGRLSEVIELLAQEHINIRALSLADTSDFGILRMLVSDNALADRTLKGKGFTTGYTDVLAVELPDVPGSLASLLRLLSSRDINVEYMYAGARRQLHSAVMIFRFDKIDGAIEILRENGFSLLRRLEVSQPV